jgi:hypothetical protein
MMDEHLHAMMYRTFVAQLDAVMQQPSGLTSEELTGVFEREGIVTMAMKLPEVRQALTIVLLQSLYRDKDTGEVYLDLDEETLIH